MLGFPGLGGTFESFSLTAQGLDRPATGSALPYNSPIPFPIAGGTAPCRQSRDACEGRPSPARESVPASLPANSWLYYLQEPLQRIGHADLQLRCVTCSDAEHAIICGEKDVNCRLFGAREMES